MSDLKHRSAAELRGIIHRSDAFVAARMGDAADMDAKAAELEAQAAKLRADAAHQRMVAHGYTQRGTWARIYLARKETGQC